MKIDDCFQLGYIIKPHGVQGTFTVYLDSDNPDYYGKLESVYIGYQQKLIPFFIDHIQIKGNKATLKLRDVDNLELANRYKGCAIFLPLKMLPALEDHQFYYHEVVGFSVADSNYGKLGVIRTIYEANGNDLFAIEYKGREVLVPIRDEFIIEFDKKAKSILVNLPDGLLDIYLNS